MKSMKSLPGSFSGYVDFLIKAVLKSDKVVVFITTFEEAFAAIVPYFLMSSFVALAVSMVQNFGTGWLDLNLLSSLLLTFNIFSSIVAIIAISYFFALRLKVSPIIAPILSIAAFVSVSLLFESPSTEIVLPQGFNMQVLFVPVVSTYFLKFFYPYLNLRIPLSHGYKHVYRLFNYLLVFVASYFATLLVYVIADYVGDTFVGWLATIFSTLPVFAKLILREICSQIFWFFGIHGPHMVNALFTKKILFEYMAPNLTVAEFIRLFVNLGGSGVGLALFIALLLFMKERTIRLITRISSPFVPFNINTLLIYAVVVLNRYFVLPFILLPIFNSVAAYAFIKTVHVSFTPQYIVWTTPVFVNSYIKTGGDVRVMLFQAFLIAVDTAVYAHFVRRFSSSRDLMSALQILEKNLDITTEIKARELVQPFKARSEIIEASVELDKTLESLTKNNLFVFYQPKINIKTGSCCGFEALIRYCNKGRLMGPVFLDIIERAGLAPVIDIWVCKRVKEHIKEWKREGFCTLISVNLHPDTLADVKAINHIISLLKGEGIMFEILEKSFIRKSAVFNLMKLQDSGFKISIDDYGTGYSNIESIINLNIDELKIDKSVISRVETHKGFVVCKHVTNLCHDLGIEVVAEGVETERQLEIVRRLDIDVVQGFYYSPAIPKEKVKKFVEDFNRRL